MRTLAAGHEDESGMLQIGDQLANLARHTAKTISPRPAAPAPNRASGCATSLRNAWPW
jgi:hypothetical protein